MKNNAIIRLTDIDHIFSHMAAAHLAHITVDLLYQCEQEGLFPYTSGDRLGFSPEEITQLSRIRRLHEDLGLDSASHRDCAQYATTYSGIDGRTGGYGASNGATRTGTTERDTPTSIADCP